jgi:small subunit ribosomal protein S17
MTTNETIQPAARRRAFIGKVVSAKAKETAVVAVERTVVHPVYGKRYRRTLRLACHNAANAYHEGDVVRVEECRPLSKTKRWRIIGKA